MQPTSAHVSQFPFLARVLSSTLDTYRESVFPLTSRPLIHLATTHTALLHARNLTSPIASTPSDIPDAANALLSLLVEYPPTLLRMHFLTLAAKTIMELVDIKEVRAQALEGLTKLKQAGEKMGKLGPGSWEAVVLETVKAKIGEGEGIDRAGLKSLADAAVGSGEGEGKGEDAKDWSALTREGYLNVWG